THTSSGRITLLPDGNSFAEAPQEAEPDDGLDEHAGELEREPVGEDGGLARGRGRAGGERGEEGGAGRLRGPEAGRADGGHGGDEDERQEGERGAERRIDAEEAHRGVMAEAEPADVGQARERGDGVAAEARVEERGEEGAAREEA